MKQTWRGRLVVGRGQMETVRTNRESIRHLPARRALVVASIAACAFTAVAIIVVPLELSDGFAVAITSLMALTTIFILTPPLIEKMKAGGMVGADVNKLGKPQVAEMGGIAALFAFSVSLSFVVGFQKLQGNVAEPPFLAAISVFFMAATIGLIDDISNLPQRLKAVAVAFAALPLMLVHLGSPIITFPLGYQWAFLGEWHLVYWLILVPVGVTGVANAMNMSAGYNGLETGQIAVASLAMLAVGEIRGAPAVAMLVFGAVLGCSLGLYVFNRFPAEVFVGDIGTLGLGAGLAAGIILAHIEFYGVITIIPAFFELGAALYYGRQGRNGERKQACRNPVITEDGRLEPPNGANHFTLAYWILSKRVMNEKQLVQALLALYGISGLCAVLLSVF